MKLQIECKECYGKCKIEFEENIYVAPTNCPYCGKELEDNEIEENIRN